MKFIKINLLSKENIKVLERTEFIWLFILLMIISSIFGGAYYFFKVHLNDIAEAQFKQVQAEMTKYENVLKQLELLESTKSTLEIKKGVINSLHERCLIFPRFMEDFASVLPTGISIKSLVTRLQPDGKISITLSGDSVSNYPIADFITMLTLNNNFSGVEIGTITTRTAPGLAPVSSFTLNFSYLRKKQA